MITFKRSIAVATAAGIFALAGISGAQAAEVTSATVTKTVLTPEQKAAYQAARAAYKTAQAAFWAAHVARVTAVAASLPAITSARAVRDAALVAATTPEAKNAARDAFKATVAAIKATYPVKPVRPIKPVRP